MSDWLGQFHAFTKKYDPVGHYAVEGPLKTADWSVKKTSEGLGRAARKAGVNSHLPDMVAEQAGDNQSDFAKSAPRHIASAALIYGGISAAGASGSGATGGGTTGVTGSNGAFLGEGASSGVPAWDGAAGGMGLGFDPSGLPDGASGASDFPSMNGGNKGLSGLGNMQGMGGQQPQQQPVERDEWQDPERVHLEGDLTLSSKRAKVPVRGTKHRGLSEIDRNGDEIADIQAMTKRVVQLRKAVTRMKGLQS
jgi:hypothetical protein